MKNKSFITNIIFFLLQISHIGLIENKVEPVYTLGLNNPLVEVSDIIINEKGIYVLTSTFPSIHFFQGEDYSNYSNFGDKGNGPMELDIPKSFGFKDNNLLVMDFRIGNCKIVTFTPKGGYVDSKIIRENNICSELKATDSKVFLELSQFGSNSREINLLEKGNLVEIMNFESKNSNRINVPGGPMNSFEYDNPYLSNFVWNIDTNGNIIYWDGNSESEELKIYNPDSKKIIDNIRLSPNLNRIEEQDITNWLDDQYSDSKPLFGISNFFKNVKKQIKKDLKAPEYFPLLNKVLLTKEGEIWLQRTFSSSKGETWTYLADKFSNGIDIQMPLGKSLKAVGMGYIVSLTINEQGEELIEVYSKQDLIKN